MIMASRDVKITSYFLNGGLLSPPSLKIYCKNGKKSTKTVIVLEYITGPQQHH